LFAPLTFMRFTLSAVYPGFPLHGRTRLDVCLDTKANA
jgi:hypothetical protein